MRNVKGYTALAVYQPKQLSHNVIWICGGELKALVAASILNEDNVGAIAITGGEGSWHSSFSKLIAGKIVFICMDVDQGGQAAARKIAVQIFQTAQAVHIVTLPLDIDKYPKGDINDWVGAEKADLAAFQEAMKNAERFAPDYVEEEDTTTEVTKVRLVNAPKTENVGKRIQLEAVVTAMDTTPFIVPKTISLSCTRDQNNCTNCAVYATEQDDKGQVKRVISSTARGLLEMSNASTKLQKEAVLASVGVPTCKTVNYNVLDNWNMFDVRLTPQLTVSGDNSDHVVQPAMMVGENLDLDLNTPYELQGRVHPHPRTQQATLLVDSVKTSEDSLTSFTPREADLAGLRVFQPATWSLEALTMKLSDLYQDLSANVTRIYRRRDLHLGLDLAWHSCIYFKFDGRRQNGWINCLITGDSSQGKSEASIRLKEHYGVGVRVDCKNATVAGLLGGLQQLGTRWFVTWGTIPVHDRQLVVLEEIKGCAVEVLGALTDMRSSGIAEISKIERRVAHARTRLVMISNPRSDKPISSYTYGVEAIKQLIGSLEDIRRFDFAMIVSCEQVDIEAINMLSVKRPSSPHIHTAELCRRLVLWVWTRSEDQVRFEPSAVDACLALSTELCNEFTETLPLVDRGTMRYKLARMAVALSARTFSVDKDMQRLVVRKCHVEYITEFLRRTYGDKFFGYKDFTTGLGFQSNLKDPNLIKRQIHSTKYSRDLVDSLLHTNSITLADLADWCEMPREETTTLLSFLVRKHALRRTKREYIKSGPFIDLLKRMRDEPFPNEAVPEQGAEF